MGCPARKMSANFQLRTLVYNWLKLDFELIRLLDEGSDSVESAPRSATARFLL